MEELAEEGLFKRMVEDHPDIIWQLDGDLKLRYVSPRAAEITGYGCRELVGKHVGDIPFIFSRKDQLDKFLGLLESHSPFKAMVAVLPTKSGKMVVLESGGKPFYGPGGDFQGYLGHTADVTDKRRTGGELSRDHVHFKDLIEGVTEIIWEMDFRGNLTYVSPQVKAILGFDPDEVKGLSIADMIQQGGRHSRSSPNMEHLKKMEPFVSVPFTMRSKGGESIVLENSGAPVFDEAGSFKGYRGVLRDVTEIKRIQAQHNWYAHSMRAIGENLPIPCYYVEAKENKVLYISRALAELLDMEPLLLKSGMGDLKDTDLTKYFLTKVEDKAGFKLRPVPRSANEVKAMDDIRFADGRTVRRSCYFVRDASGELIGRNIGLEVVSGPHAQGVTDSGMSVVEAMAMGADIGLVALSKEAKVMAMNPTAERMIGFRSADVKGKMLKDIVTFQNTKGMAKSDPLPLDAEVRRVSRRELFMIRRDGTTRTIVCSIDLCRSADPELGMVVTMADRSSADDKPRYPAHAK